MRLEYANLICPKCGNGNYMRHLVGENVGELNVKCINCNSCFKLSDFYRMVGKAEAYTMTNADRIRSMTDDELADFMIYHAACTGLVDESKCLVTDASLCDRCWLDWLKAEGGE